MSHRREARIKCPTYRNIPVSSEIILTSERGITNNCMLFRAVKDHIPGASRIMVDLQFIRFSVNGIRFRYHTPTRAAYNLASFEAGDEVRPFTFTLEGSGAEASVSAKTKTTPGSAASIRSWAVAHRLMTQEQADRQGKLSEAIKTAYLEEYPETAQTVNNRRRGDSRMRTRPAHERVKMDRFYGLRLQNGFKPGGEPT